MRGCRSLAGPRVGDAPQIVRRDPRNMTLLDEVVHDAGKPLWGEPAATGCAEDQVVALHALPVTCVLDDCMLLVLDEHLDEPWGHGDVPAVALRHRLEPGPPALDHQLLFD